LCFKELEPDATTAPFLLLRGSMSTRLIPGRKLQRRYGFTLVEMVFVFAIVGIMALMVMPRIQQVLQASQVSRAAATVATDLERAFTMAGRYRKPMRLSCVCGSGTYTVADRTGGTVRLSRNLLNGGELGRMTLTFSETPVDIFPSGVVSIATPPLTVRITSGISTRGVTMTTAGQVRIIP
jgi:prepilin-type N-terminal cleavage/methylation domain-containing protein